MSDTGIRTYAEESRTETAEETERAETERS
jgi:hypothetical protein